MTKVILNKNEIDLLDMHQPGATGGGYQNIFSALHESLNRETGEITLSDELLARVQNGALRGQGGWQGRLLSIFQRTLGPNLDGDLP